MAEEVYLLGIVKPKEGKSEEVSQPATAESKLQNKPEHGLIRAEKLTATCK